LINGCSSSRAQGLPSSTARASGCAGSLVLIERGDRHEIRNTGRTLLKTLNVYVPPGYTAGGHELPRADGQALGTTGRALVVRVTPA